MRVFPEPALPVITVIGHDTDVLSEIAKVLRTSRFTIPTRSPTSLFTLPISKHRPARDLPQGHVSGEGLCASFVHSHPR